MAKKRKGKFKEFLGKVASKLPGLASDVLEVATSPNPGGAAFQLLKEKLAGVETGKIGDELLAEANSLTEDDFKAFELEETSRQRATDNYVHSKDTTDDISKSIFKRNIPYVFGAIVFVALINVGITLWVPEDLQLVVLQAMTPVVALVGALTNSLLDERKQVTGFYLGSSLGSKEKDKKINLSI